MKILFMYYTNVEQFINHKNVYFSIVCASWLSQYVREYGKESEDYDTMKHLNGTLDLKDSKRSRLNPFHKEN